MTINETELATARTAWGTGLVAISKAYDETGIDGARDLADSLLDSLYGKGQPPGRQPIASDTQTLTAVRPAAVTAPSPTITELVSELSWVRNRLMGLRGEQHDEKLNKALAYLDLVTQDMERWVANRPDGKTP